MYHDICPTPQPGAALMDVPLSVQRLLPVVSAKSRSDHVKWYWRDAT